MMEGPRSGHDHAGIRRPLPAKLCRPRRPNPVGDTTPCECSADLARHGPRPRRVARPRAECQRPSGAFVRAIREECLNRLILFGERRLRRASMRPGALTSGAELSGARQRGSVGAPDRPRPSKRRSSAGTARAITSTSGLPPVTWAEARPARHPADPGDDLSGRGLGAVRRHPRQPIPLAVQAGRDPGARTACSCQEHGVDVSSDSSEPLPHPPGVRRGPSGRDAIGEPDIGEPYQQFRARQRLPAEGGEVLEVLHAGEVPIQWYFAPADSRHAASSGRAERRRRGPGCARDLRTAAAARGAGRASWSSPLRSGPGGHRSRQSRPPARRLPGRRRDRTPWTTQWPR
jgi:hypothetical protein